MNLLLDKAPHEVRIAGDLVPIRADFRQSIRFEQLMQDLKPYADLAGRTFEAR